MKTDAQFSRNQKDPDGAVQIALQTLDRAVSAGSGDRIARNLEIRSRRRQRRRLALGALGVGLLLGGFVFWPSAPSFPAADRGLAITAVVTAPQTQSLPDGSVVELKPGTRFELAFSPAVRRVVLQAGEAHFSVKKDPSRPFVVVAGAVEVRAVGTAFAVDFSDRSVAVLVTEGRVAVTAPDATRGAADATRLTELVDAGQRAVLELHGALEALPWRVSSVTPSEAADRLSWRMRRLEFAGTPLAEAIPRFNRHAGTRLSLDPALGSLRLSGALRVDDLDALLLLLRSEFDLVADPQADGSITLRRR
jgi:transmembrane sensor